MTDLEIRPLPVQINIPGTESDVLEALREGVQIWDACGHLIYANPATERLFGDFSRTQPGIHWLDWLPVCFWHGGLNCSASDFPVHLVLENKAVEMDRPLQILRPDGSPCWVNFHAEPLRDPATQSITGVVSSTIDVTPWIAQEGRLKQAAHFDRLTGLPNRSLFADRIQQAVARSRRTGELLAVCLMDLDGFKAVNDTLGHGAGDRLLQEISRRLQGVVSAGDTVARLGGDEFALLLAGQVDLSGCERLLTQLLLAVAQPVQVEGTHVRVSASIGVTLCPADPAEPEQLMRHADQAMYRAKLAGKNCYELFNQTQESKLRANQSLLRKIEQAMERKQFQLYYQPKVNCREGKVVGLEALLRWEHPILGQRPPGEFLPLIEQDDLIIRLGEWVVVEAMNKLAELHAAGQILSISINVAAHQFLHGHFVERLGELLQAYPPELVRYLEIEILESAALQDVGLVTRLIQAHRTAGVGFALDDFGTGFSSLAHLKHLPVDTLKIDQTFVHDMLNDAGDLSIVQAVIRLAQSFQRHVVAEGVESIEQLLSLMALGCEVVQGYVIARPMRSTALLPWLQGFRPDPRWQLASSDYPSRADFQMLMLESEQQHVFDRLLNPLAKQGFIGLANSANSHFSAWLGDSGVRGCYGSSRLFHEMEMGFIEYHQILEAFSRGELVTGGTEALRAAHEKFCNLLRRFRLSRLQQAIRALNTN